MPRQLRLEYQGAVYHVMARGNRKESIFREDRDRFTWLDYLGIFKDLWSGLLE
jgi:putative transposase